MALDFIKRYTEVVGVDNADLDFLLPIALYLALEASECDIIYWINPYDTKNVENRHVYYHKAKYLIYFIDKTPNKTEKQQQILEKIKKLVGIGDGETSDHG